jgi:ubiquinone/menaquinone biosynthesis C-methylase UbiE
MSYYNEIASGYNQLHQDEQLKKLETMWQVGRSMNLFENVSTILDVGCGTGISSDFFAEKKLKVTGIDPAEKLLEQNVRKISKLITAPAELIPFKDNAFDLVISVTAIQNFDNLQKGLDEIKRVGNKRFILTFLKGVKKKEIIDEAILNTFNVTRIISDEKDTYYFI